MTTRLAKLDDLKTMLGISSTDSDALLLLLLEQASARCGEASLVGRSLLRQAGLVQYPVDHPYDTRSLRLSRLPIESISSVKQLYSSSTVADFTSADALEEGIDFEVDAEQGQLDRINGLWYAAPRCVQLIYTGGFGDPANLEVIAVSGNADAVSVRLGEITIDSVDLVYPGEAVAVDSLTDDDTTYIWIESSAGAAQISSAIDATGWPATAHEKLAEVVMVSGAIAKIINRRTQLMPPANVQRGILAESVQQFHHRNTGGVVDGQLAGRGSISSKVLDAHPMLVDACQQLRRYLL